MSSAPASPGSELFDVVLETAVDGIIVIDMLGIIKVWSRSCRRLFGYEPGEVIGRNVSMLMPLAYAGEHDRYLRDYIRTGDAHIIGIGREVEGLRKDGSVFPLHLSVGEGVLNGQRIFVGTLHDLTALREGAAATRRLAAIVRSSADAIMSKTTEGVITSWNEAAERIFGYSESEILGRSVRLLIPPDRQAEEDMVLERLRRGESTENLETVRLRKDGSRVSVATTVSPLITQGGEIAGGSVILRDVTEQVEAKRMLARQASALKRSNDVLSQFAYAASHDLQEPLRAVAGSIQLLAKRYSEQIDNRGREFISHAVDGVQRMHRMIDDLLDYSRVRPDGSAGDIVALSAAIESSIANLSSAIAESNAKLTIGHLPIVPGNKSLLARLFQNLISNAIKFRKKGTAPVVAVSAEQLDDDWIVTVKDNGIGIAERDRGRIFELFQRLHTREEYPGTGVGLALCKRIAEAHHGGLTVNSVPGEGSEFIVRLPAAKV